MKLFDDDLRELALDAAERAGGPTTIPVNAELLAAAKAKSVDAFTRTTGLVKSEESRALLLTEFMSFPKGGQVRLLQVD